MSESQRLVVGLACGLVWLSQLGCREVVEVLHAAGGSGLAVAGAAPQAGASSGGVAGASAGSGGAGGEAGEGTPPNTGGVAPVNPALGITVDSGDAHSCATRFGALYCWGANMDGRLGLGDTLARNAPTRVGFDADWVAVATGVAHTCALKEDGSVWCFGANTVGQLGRGNAEPSSVPLRVPLAGKVVQLSSGVDTACTVLETGELYCWGRNFEGNIGLNDDHPGIDQLSPVRSGDQSDWQLTGTGDGHTCGIRGAGLLFGWGRNSAANLGLGQITDQQRRSATQIGVDEDWLSVVSGQDSSCGIRATDDSGELGNLFCWGGNSFANLGLGDRDMRLLPTQVAPGRLWRQVAIDTFHGCGIDSENELYCWGRNIEGQLGVADNDDRLAPEPIGLAGNAGPLNARSVVVGRMSSCAVTTDERVFCTGENAGGQLGLADNTRRNAFTELAFSPVD